MVHLTRIYTRTGDGGSTRLVDNTLVAKTDSRVEAYGTVDELNSAIGVAVAAGDLTRSMLDALRIIQNELFDLGCDLATPLDPDATTEPLRIIPTSIERLESWCDDFMSGLAELNSFVLPGGSVGAAHLHVCRTICRRAERSAWHAANEFGTDTPGGVSALADHLPEQALGSALHPGPGGQPSRRGHALGAGRRSSAHPATAERVAHWDRWYPPRPGGAPSNHDKRPVSSWLPSAISTDGASLPATTRLMMRCPSYSDKVSRADGVRWSAIAVLPRWNRSRGVMDSPNTRCHSSQSPE